MVAPVLTRFEAIAEPEEYADDIGDQDHSTDILSQVNIGTAFRGL